MTQYDVICVLPFDGAIVLTEMKGSLLTKVLDQGLQNQGTFGYLQKTGVQQAAAGGWEIDGMPVDPEATYQIVLTELLLTGREAYLGYLTKEIPDLEVLQTLDDIRKVVIAELERRYGS